MKARCGAGRLGLLGTLPALVALAAACGNENAASNPPCEAPALLDDPVFETSEAGVAAADPHHDPHHDARWVCKLTPDVPTSQSVTGDLEGLRAKIKHVFVLMLENRSFDQFLSQLTVPQKLVWRDPSAEQPPLYDASEVDVATDETNPRPDGSPEARYHAPHLCLQDVSHEWLASHVQYDNGLNDGFVRSGGKRAMAYYGADDLPYHYFLADTFAISDRYFSSVMGPTWPNHLFFWGGTSCGYAEDATTNPGVISQCGAKTASLFTRLGDDIEIFDDSGEIAVGSLIGTYRSLPKSIQAFEQAAAHETEIHSELAKVVMLGATNTTINLPFVKKTQNDDHASVNVQLAQLFIYQMVQTITSNPALWESSVLFITWDENGGFYDHVPPPKACHPESNPAPDAPPFDRLGFRVPLYVVSPYVRRHYVSHYIADHTSILRFIEAWLDEQPFSQRDANAWPLLDFFDFEQAQTEVPEFKPEWVEPSADGLAECAANPQGFNDD